MALRGVRYLVKRQDVFYYRMPIPVALLYRFQRREIKHSLKTTNLPVARMRCRNAANFCETLISLVEAVPDLTTETLNHLIQEYFAGIMGDVSTVVEFSSDIDIEAEIEGEKVELMRLRKQIAERDYSTLLMSQASDLLHTKGMKKLPRGSEEYDYLCHGLLRAKAEQRRVLIALLQGQYDKGKPEDPLFKDNTQHLLGPVSDQKKISVGELCDKFIAAKSQVWAKKTIYDNRRVVSWFRELVGEGTSIDSVTIATVRDYRDLLLKLPKNLSKVKDLKDLPLLEAIKVSESTEKLSGKTAKKYLEMLKSFLDWCRKEGYVSVNPGGDIEIPLKENAKEARYPFTEEQLSKLFQSPQYTGHKSSVRRYITGDQLIRDAKFWIPLIGLFTGMRLGEIVQLLVSDIKKIDNVWVFNITTGGESNKTLKTQSSDRFIPVHPELHKIGFLEFVQGKSCKGASNQRLFNDVGFGAEAYPSSRFSKYINRYFGKIGIKTAKTAFHSLRHNFKDAMHAAGIQDSRQNALMGHADKSAAGIYGKGIPATALYDDICKVKYGVELSHLWANVPK